MMNTIRLIIINQSAERLARFLTMMGEVGRVIFFSVKGNYLEYGDAEG